MPAPGTEKQASILIIDDNEDVLVLMDSILRREGYRTLLARNGEAGLELAREKVPDLVLLDLNMPGLKGLDVCRHLKNDPKTHGVVVIILSAITDVGVKAKGFHLGAVDYISKPFRHMELLARVRAQLRQKAEYDKLRRQYCELSDKLSRQLTIGSEVVDQGCIQREQKVLRFDNDIGRVQGIVNQLLIGVGRHLNPKLRTDLALGLHEMVLNAIEHGNLGIQSSEKACAIESDALFELIEARRAEPERANTQVAIYYEFDGECVTYRIQDEGEGFEWKPFLERDAPEDLLASSGRGIMISRYIFDTIDYNDAGNEVVLAKMIHPPTTAPTSELESELEASEARLR